MNDAADFRAQAERHASAILAEYPVTDLSDRDKVHALVALAYAQGARDELAMLPGRVDEILTTILESVGVEREPFDPNAPRTYDVSGGEFKPVKS